jgi:hypothetical protein
MRSTQLFDIQKAAEDVYFARARAQAEINSNSAIFVNSTDVLVVDSHSKPSAAASLIAQIKKEVTSKPVRYVVNSHFHWDHTQGNHAYRIAESKIDFIASEPTKQLMADLAQVRLKESLAEVPKQIEMLRARASKSRSKEEKAFCEDQIRQLQSYRRSERAWKRRSDPQLLSAWLFSHVPEIRLAAYARTDSRRPALCGCGKQQRKS